MKPLKLCKRIFCLLVAGTLSVSLFSVRPDAAEAAVTPNPVISRDVPAYGTPGNSGPTTANDSSYTSTYYGPVPGYLAYDLSGVPAAARAQILAVWYNPSYHFDGSVLDNATIYSAPKSYTIEANAAAGGAYPEDGWEVLETVTDNTCHSRQHLLDFTGYNWVRLNVSEAHGTVIGLNFDIHSCPQGATDSWLFLGDSITAGGMTIDGTGYGTFAELIHGMNSTYFPAAENGGIGGILSTNALPHLDRWLTQFPGRYVCLAYGTNDAWGNQTGTSKFYTNLETMVQKIIAAGKTPVVSKIPFSLEPNVQTNVPAYNAEITRLYAAYPEIVPGPDFEAFFSENQTLLSTDGVHPNEEGYAMMRKVWAETMFAAVYSSTATALSGDADCSGAVNRLDVSALSDHLVRRSSLTAAGAQNADLCSDRTINAFDLVLLKRTIADAT